MQCMRTPLGSILDTGRVGTPICTRIYIPNCDDNDDIFCSNDRMYLYLYVYKYSGRAVASAAVRDLLIKKKKQTNKQLRCYLWQRLDGFTAWSRYFRGKKKIVVLKYLLIFLFLFFLLRSYFLFFKRDEIYYKSSRVNIHNTLYIYTYILLVLTIFTCTHYTVYSI
jgi:hypothetical protein